MGTAEADPSEVASNPGAHALEQFNEGEWTTAIDLARQQISAPFCSNVIKAEMHHIEAACLYQMGQLEEAEAAIRAAVLIEPIKENYLNTYGVILRKNKRVAEADIGAELEDNSMDRKLAEIKRKTGNAQARSKLAKLKKMRAAKEGAAENVKKTI